MVTKVKELADAEADRVEAEEDEPGTEAPPAPDDATDEEEEAASTPPAPPVEPSPAAISDTEIEQAQKRIALNRRALAKILGPDYVAHECVLCSGVGFLPEYPPAGTAFTLIDTEDGYAFDVQAPGDLSQYEQAPDKAPCPECNALGQVRTGSRNPHAMIAGCSKCSGNGWVTIPRDAAGNGSQGAGATVTLPVQPAAEMMGINDAWGRAPGHQYWGVPPEQVKG